MLESLDRLLEAKENLSPLNSVTSAAKVTLPLRCTPVKLSFDVFLVLDGTALILVLGGTALVSSSPRLMARSFGCSGGGSVAGASAKETSAKGTRGLNTLELPS